MKGAEEQFFSTTGNTVYPENRFDKDCTVTCLLLFNETFSQPGCSHASNIASLSFLQGKYKLHESYNIH